MNLFKLVPKMPEMNDDEWAEHDARIKAERERFDTIDGETKQDRRTTLINGGAPEVIVDGVTDPQWRPAKADESLDGFNTDDRRIRIISGGPGSGKTWAAVRWASEHGGRTPLFMRAQAFNSIGRYDRDYRNKWLTASSLVFDDLGAEYCDKKGNFMADLDELIDVYSGRYARMVITTNLTPNAFKERYSARIISRARGRARWRSVKSSDMRTPAVQ